VYAYFRNGKMGSNGHKKIKSDYLSSQRTGRSQPTFGPTFLGEIERGFFWGGGDEQFVDFGVQMS
jgi:hypothetical protein